MEVKITLLPFKKKKWSSPLLSIILFCLAVGRFVSPFIRRQGFRCIFCLEGWWQVVTCRDVIYKKWTGPRVFPLLQALKYNWVIEENGEVTFFPGFFLMSKQIFQCCMCRTEYSLFRANENVLHDYVWEGPGFVNLNSVISYQRWNREPVLIDSFLFPAITVRKDDSGIPTNVVFLHGCPC